MQICSCIHLFVVFCCWSASLTQFKSHSHIRACVSTRRRRAIFSWANQLSCHANKIKSQRAYDKCTKIIKCDSNERTRQAKPNGKEAAAAGGTWLSACLPACMPQGAPLYDAISLTPILLVQGATSVYGALPLTCTHSTLVQQFACSQ